MPRKKRARPMKRKRPGGPPPGTGTGGDAAGAVRRRRRRRREPTETNQVAPDQQDKAIRAQGVVAEKLPDAKFRVEVQLEGRPPHEVLAHVSGKIRMRYIRIMAGDLVSLELTPYDLTRGRIVWLHK